MDNQKIIDEVMGSGLRVLNRIADSPLVERFGLEARAQSKDTATITLSWICC